ncbi:hypothetical protein A8H39_00900 [Paraburkholderia fungorum]|uniref:hypothetical protein n=1 Tax=Paraburkholderia fungorum TaxID=134537 RepID=UPI00047F89B6|nr:hypothetical protein [Paraburkholderia fungorum]PNE59738.1 hypothetical protein A8H39_00900 [Paraburkholderia fungorum]
MSLIAVVPENRGRAQRYAYLYGAMKVLARPDESAMRYFSPGEQILGIEDVNNVVTIKYRNKAALVQYSGLVIQAWKHVASSIEVPFLRHATPDGAVVVGDPNARPEQYETKVEPGAAFRGNVYPEDGARTLSLGMVIGALHVQGHPYPLAKDAPKLIGTHIGGMGWQSGVVVVEWNTPEAFLAYGYIVMYAWRVAGNQPSPGTVRHLLPDGSHVECNLWEEDPWRTVVSVIDRHKAK